MRMSDLTAVGRVLHPRYATHRALAALTLLAGVAGGAFHLFSGVALLESALWGVGAGFAVYFAWALGRELDPDHDLSAFVGVGLMLVGLPLFGLPSLMVLFWLLVALRVLNRTVGLPARPLDSLGVLILGGWLTWQGYWMVGLMTAVALLLDGLLPKPLRYHLLLSGFAFLATVVLSIFHGDIAMESGPTLPTVISVVVMGGLFLVVIVTSRDLEAVGDATGEPLHPKRVQAAQAFALLTALLMAWWEGASGVVALAPFWAALLGVALYRLAILFLSRRR
jgi:hypothetical protein